MKTFSPLVLALLLGFGRQGSAADWIEVRSPNFRVIANTGEKDARAVARELEQIRLVFRKALVNMVQDPEVPIIAFAVRNEDSFRELLPAYWEREGTKPAGVFHRGSGKHYVVVRVDIRPEDRYKIVYHEYFHLLLSLNLHRLPVWLNEGLAAFWEQTRIRGDRVSMGMPEERYLFLLFQRSMMPLHELLSMKVNPHSFDPDRVYIFYAQAWALTHLLLLGEKGDRGKSLGTYVGMVEEGSDPQQAFVSVYGALDAMEEKLAGYIRQTRMPALEMEAPETIDDDSFGVRVLPEASAAAERGNFLVSGARPDAALPLLERALELAPDDSLALESMGFYHFRKQENEAAREWFSKAAKVDSENFLCHYYLALLLMSDSDNHEQAKESLHRSISLNPKFAPAYADLGRLFAATGVRLIGAYGLAAKATQLEPDNAWYWVNLGQILLKMEKPEEARSAGERAAREARSEPARGMVERFQRDIENYSRSGVVPALEANTPAMTQGLEASTPRIQAGDRRIEGRFTELRCGDKIGSFDFVLVSDGKTYVLHVDVEKIHVIMNGGTRHMICGPQDARVAVIFTPSSEPSVEEGRGELRVLEFLN